VTVANLVTGFRLLPFALFIWFAHQGNIVPAASMFLLAWGLDAVDGLAARALQQETVFGYVFDKAVDRLVLVCGLFVLIVLNVVPLGSLFLITKDVIVIPTVVRRGAEGAVFQGLGLLGRVASLLQGSALLWLMLGWPGSGLIISVVGIFSVWVGVRYLQELQDVE